MERPSFAKNTEQQQEKKQREEQCTLCDEDANMYQDRTETQKVLSMELL